MPINHSQVQKYQSSDSQDCQKNFDYVVTLQYNQYVFGRISASRNGRYPNMALLVDQ